ncbi:MAG: TonB-dependent receptor [Phycisphaerales bacterium]|nr:MAG: TonB-dependent receptor [Phycisphaerales bacterium]
MLRFDIDNRAEASLCGIELDTTYSVTDDLTLLWHYTYQDLNWRSSAPFHEKELLSSPHNKFMIAARYSVNDDLHLSGHLYYVDEVKSPNPENPFVPRSIDSYFRLDVPAEYEFMADRASVAIGARNLLDSNHYEGGTLFLNDAEVPRMIYAESRLAIR